VEYPEVVILVNITRYAKHWGIGRDAVYLRLKEGKIKAYRVQGEEEKTYLNLNEDPQVREYGKSEEEPTGTNQP